MITCKNEQIANEFKEAVSQINYESYIEWINGLQFEIKNRFRYKEAVNRMKANRLAKENPGKIKICSRCEGKGRLKEFITALNPGTCFKCKGFGYINID